MTSPLRVLVADDQLLFAQALSAALSARPGIDLVPSTPTSGIETIEVALSHRPDVLVVDSHIRGTSISTVIAPVRERVPGCRVVVLTWFGTPGDVEEAIAAGAAAVLLKNIRVEDLSSAIHDVGQRKLLLSPGFDRAVVQKINEHTAPLAAGDPSEEEVSLRVASLSPRELEVLDILSAGVRLEDAATLLGIQPKTLRNHVHRLCAKLGVRSRVEAVAFAHRYEVILPGRYVEETVTQKHRASTRRKGTEREGLSRSPIKVLVADAQLLFSDSLALSLSQRADLETVSQRPMDANDALYTIAQHKPDVAILDFWMEGCADVMQPGIFDSFAPCRILLLSWVHSGEHIRVALRAGAAGFMSKTTSLDRLENAVRRASAGEMLVYGEELADLIDVIERRDHVVHEVYDRFVSLTAREKDVLSLLARGFTLDEAARQLHVTRGAVRYHVRNVTKKTGARSIPEAVAMAGWSGFGTF